MNAQPDISPTHRDVLAAAVARIGGAERPGQIAMADAIAAAFDSGEHLLVQAGTGTGKSLGYLAPALLGVAQRGGAVVVATATLALQAQLATNDIPAAVEAVAAVTGKRPTFAVLKGRTNYACLLRVHEAASDDQSSLIAGSQVADALRSAGRAGDSVRRAESIVGAEVVALREWAEQQLADGATGDRDTAPSHTPRAWAQVSVPVRECVGAQRCPYGQQCFVEKSRDDARKADLIVTNHALLAIDAMHGGTALPDHDLVIIDEAHELVSRVTGAASQELSSSAVDRVARRALPWLDDEEGLELLESAIALGQAINAAPLHRVDDAASGVAVACAGVRDAARHAMSRLGGKDAAAGDVARVQAAAAVKEIFDIAERMAKLAASDVVWVSEHERLGRGLRVAPLSVAGLMRDAIFARTPTVLTSATLKIGGDFEATAVSVGLRDVERADRCSDGEPGVGAQTWRGLDVGSPFDYRRQGILYVAEHLPSPRRDGITDEALTEIAELVWAAGGRTLGLFATQRAAEVAAAAVRTQLPRLTVLCQGDAQLSELMKRFLTEPESSLFGTVSLWQGIDVPGDACELVIIDKIPFPRPDEPLLVARQRAVTLAGGNGFMQVAAAHAALLLAQGSGRLIRRLDDRGVVAVLDPRLLTARYGPYLRASMPDFWTTTDREVAVQALKRLAATQPSSSGQPAT